MADIREIAQELVQMTSVEAQRLNNQLRQEYGMPTVRASYGLGKPKQYIHHHQTSDECKKNKVEKRRKKNKNKKTHRR